MNDVGTILKTGECKHCRGKIELTRWMMQEEEWLHTATNEIPGRGMQGSHCPGQYRAEPVEVADEAV